LREISPFPDEPAGGAPAHGAPSEVAPKQVRELHIRLNLPDKSGICWLSAGAYLALHRVIVAG